MADQLALSHPATAIAMAIYCVTIPIAGHAILTVEASSKEEAIEKGMEGAKLADIETWECLEQFNSGNVCHCPSPWKAEAELEDDD
jgi:hypothetical protein